MDRLISEEKVMRVVRHLIRWMDCECDKSEDFVGGHEITHAGKRRRTRYVPSL